MRVADQEDVPIFYSNRETDTGTTTSRKAVPMGRKDERIRTLEKRLRWALEDRDKAEVEVERLKSIVARRVGRLDAAIIRAKLEAERDEARAEAEALLAEVDLINQRWTAELARYSKLPPLADGEEYKHVCDKGCRHFIAECHAPDSKSDWHAFDQIVQELRDLDDYYESTVRHELPLLRSRLRAWAARNGRPVDGERSEPSGEGDR